MNIRVFAVAGAAAILLAGCGGGGSSSPAANQLPAATPTAQSTIGPTSSRTMTLTSQGGTLTLPASSTGLTAQIVFPLVIAGDGATVTATTSAVLPPGVPPIGSSIPDELSTSGGSIAVHSVVQYVTFSFSQSVAFLQGTQYAGQSLIQVVFGGSAVSSLPSGLLLIATLNTPNRGQNVGWTAPFYGSFTTVGSSFTYNDNEANPWPGGTTFVYALAR